MSLYEEYTDELATWPNYRELLHAIFQTPKREKTREDHLAQMREWWHKEGKWRRKLKNTSQWQAEERKALSP